VVSWAWAYVNVKCAWKAWDELNSILPKAMLNSISPPSFYLLHRVEQPCPSSPSRLDRHSGASSPFLFLLRSELKVEEPTLIMSVPLLFAVTAAWCWGSLRLLLKVIVFVVDREAWLSAAVSVWEFIKVRRDSSRWTVATIVRIFVIL
jgi:hypothetical protein